MAQDSDPSGNRRVWQQMGLQSLTQLGRPTVLATLAASVLVLGGRSLGLFQGMELAAYDHFLRQRPADPPDNRLLIVGITEADIQTRQEWPMSDQTIAEVLTKIAAAEPRAIGLDLFRDVPFQPGHETLLTTLSRLDNVFAVCKISSPDNPGVAPPASVPEHRVGFSDLVIDSGGILRRTLIAASPPPDSTAVVPHLCNQPKTQLFSLALQLAAHYLAAEGITPTVTATGEIRLADTTLPRLNANMGGYHDVDDAGYQMLLNYRSARNAVPQVSLSAVLAGEVPPAQIRDRLVLIGTTTPEAKDEFYTPYSGGLRDSQKMPGVMVHAQSTSQILSAVLDDRPLIWSWPTSLEVLWIVAWGVGGAVFASYVRRPWRFALGAVVLAGALYGLCYGLFLQAGWVPLVPPVFSLALGAAGVVLIDRFNRSEYGQSVYRQVKSFLKLDIEIDEARVGEQVAQITETDYFAQLQQRARDLRQRKQPSAGVSAPSPAAPDPEETPEDYLDRLRLEARRLKGSSSPASKDSTSEEESGHDADQTSDRDS